MRALRTRPEVAAIGAVVRRRDRVLLARRVPSGLLGGLWELPTAEVDAAEVAPAAVVRAMRNRVGLQVEVGAVLGAVRHVFTHRALTLTIFDCTSSRGRLRPAEGYDDATWVSPRDESLPLSSLAKKALALVE